MSEIKNKLMALGKNPQSQEEYEILMRTPEYLAFTSELGREAMMSVINQTDDVFPNSPMTVMETAAQIFAQIAASLIYAGTPEERPEPEAWRERYSVFCDNLMRHLDALDNSPGWPPENFEFTSQHDRGLLN